MTRRFGVLGPALHRAGWDVVPLKAREKFPIIDNWQHGLTADEVHAHAANGSAEGNVGLIAARFPAVDIDVLDAVCAEAIQEFALDFFGPAPMRYGKAPKRLLMYAAKQPFAKAKVYLTDPLGNTAGPDGKDYAVEVLGQGQQFVIFGRHPEGFEYEWPHEDGPDARAPTSLTVITVDQVNAWLDALPMFLPPGWAIRKAGRPAASIAASEDAALALYKPALEGWDEQRIREEIGPHLDPEMHYDDWLEVGQALHHQFGGAAEGLSLWDELFQHSTKYQAGYAEKKWASFSTQRPSGHGPLTLATIIKNTKSAREAAQGVASQQAMEAARALIESCPNDMALRKGVAQAIQSDTNLDRSQREILVGLFNGKHKALTGTKLPVKDVRALLNGRPAATVNPTAGGVPDWARPWVYITDCDKFLNLISKEEVSRQGFKSKFNRYMPQSPFTGRLQADQVALDEWRLPTVAHKAYMPSAGPVFSFFDLDWANLYRVESVPEVPGVLSDADQEAITLVMSHFEAYLPDQRERGLFMSWVAYNVQHPGVKVRWSPYLHGPPGDGKSFFGELLGRLMGAQNVRTLNGSTLESNFTDWAIGHAVTIVEEMKQHGHNRHDVMNKIKPFITNSEVEIHPKGKRSYSAPNCTNYLLLSNYLDGAPVGDSDRRYMFLSSALTADGAKRMTEEGYFSRLFTAVEDHAGALRQHFLAMPRHPEFDANGRAPFTSAKATVIEMSKSDLEMAVEELLENGAVGVCSEVVSSAHLSRALKARMEDTLNTQRVHRMLSLKGYVYLTRRWWEGQACRIWVRQGTNWNEDDALQRLKATLGADFA